MTLPVPLATALAIYFVIWWIVLFAVLPFGVRSQEEVGDVVPGSERGAPHAPMLVKKAIATTIVSALVFIWLMIFIAYESPGGSA